MQAGLCPNTSGKPFPATVLPVTGGSPRRLLFCGSRDGGISRGLKEGRNQALGWVRTAIEGVQMDKVANEGQEDAGPETSLCNNDKTRLSRRQKGRSGERARTESVRFSVRALQRTRASVRWK